jgi:sec-independent protein translocase protein TatA
MPFGLGIWEIAILAGILVLLFGSKGAAGAAKSLGRSVREVQDAVKDVDPRRILDPAEDDQVAKPARGERIVTAERAVPVMPAEHAPAASSATTAPPPDQA